MQDLNVLSILSKQSVVLVGWFVFTRDGSISRVSSLAITKNSATATDVAETNAVADVGEEAVREGEGELVEAVEVLELLELEPSFQHFSSFRLCIRQLLMCRLVNHLYSRR